MLDWVKRLFAPVKAGTRQLTTILVKKSPPPPTPDLDEFVSPLQDAIKTEMQIKQDIGYNAHCVNCQRQEGADTRLLDTVISASDPEPWLQALHGELILTREDLKTYRTENQVLRLELEAVRSDVNPIKRMLYLFGAGLAGLGAKAVWDLWLQQYLINLLPLAIGFLIR